MRRKLAALLLCLLLVFQLSPVPSGAAETVYFTAVNKNVLTLSDDTMPFWSGGYLYVPSTIFTGVGRDLGVSYYPNIARQTVLLYVDKTVYSSLVFDLNKDYAIDNEGNLYFQKPIQRGGVIFLPISLIARCFGLLYSTGAIWFGCAIRIWIWRSGTLPTPPSPGWTTSTTSTCGTRVRKRTSRRRKRSPPPSPGSGFIFVWRPRTRSG